MTDRNKLIEAIKAVNDSGLATKKARTVGKIDVLVEDFLSTVETVPQEKEAQLPAAVVELFNELIDKLAAADTAAAEQPAAPAAPEPTPVVQPIPEATAEPPAPAKPKRAAKAKAVAAEAPATPAATMPEPAAEGEIDTGDALQKLIAKVNGRGDNRTTYVVDKMLVAGATKEEMADVAKNTAVALGQVQYQRGVGDITVHINSRSKSGWVIGETPDGKFKLIGVRKGAQEAA